MRLKQPTRELKAGRLLKKNLRAPLFGLAPGGVYLATPVTRDTGELLPRLFTLTAGTPAAVSFLWHFPWGRPRSPLATTLPCGARTFL